MMPRRQQGISLMESLVAMLVVALGLLGVLGLQMHNLSETRDSLHRAQAARLIQDLSERLRSQPQAIALAAAGELALDWAPASASSCRSGCASGECSANELIRYELACWQARVAARLPLGQAQVFSSSDSKQLGVMLAWRIGTEPSAIDALLSAASAVNCPADYRCHLQYIHLSQRWLPDL